MPFVEQAPLYKIADRWAKNGPGNYPWWPWGDFWNASPSSPPNPALSVNVPVYTCPADDRSLLAQSVTQQPYPPITVAFTSYLGNVGSVDGLWNQSNGVVFWQSKLKITSIRDGTSNTFLVGERPPSNDLVYGWWFAGAGWDGSGVGDVLMAARATGYAASAGLNNGGPCDPTYTMFKDGRTDNPCDQVHWWSLHDGGSNFAMCDGSVQFIFYASDNVMPALTTRSGGETVNIDQ